MQRQPPIRQRRRAGRRRRPRRRSHGTRHRRSRAGPRRNAGGGRPYGLRHRPRRLRMPQPSRHLGRRQEGHRSRPPAQLLAPGPDQPGPHQQPPRPGDLIFWDTDPNDGIRYGGDLDHTRVSIGDGQAIDANAYYGRVKYDSVTLGGTERDPVYVDVLTPNGY